MSLHYLVKRGCSKCLPNAAGLMLQDLLQSDYSFGVKVKRAYCHGNFLA